MSVLTPTPRNTRLALDTRSKMHVIIRQVTSADTSAAIEQNHVNPDELNDFFLTRDVEELVLQADRLGPMFPPSDLPADRVLSVTELGKASVGGRLGAADPHLLLAESYFDPFSSSDGKSFTFEEVGRLARAATNRAATNFSMFGDDGFVSGEHSYIIEPLHDWLLMRNLMSIAMRILACASSKDTVSASVLQNAGFSLVEPTNALSKKAMGGPALVVPVGYNPFFSRPTIDLTWKDSDIWPFFSKLTDMEQTAAEKFIGIRRPKHLKGDLNTIFLTSVEVGREEPSLGLKLTENVGAKWMYMAILQNGRTQEQSANGFIQALDKLFGSSTIACGGPKSEEVRTVDSPSNLVGAIWSCIKQHPKRYLMSCKYCHRTLFANMLGGETTFCSPSCRSAYSKAQKNANS